MVSKDDIVKSTEYQRDNKNIFQTDVERFYYATNYFVKFDLTDTHTRDLKY